MLHDAILAVRSTHPSTHANPTVNSTTDHPSNAKPSSHQTKDKDTTTYSSSNTNHDRDGDSLNVKSVQLVLRIAAITSKVCHEMMALTGSSERHNGAVDATNTTNPPLETTTMNHSTTTGSHAGGSSSVHPRVGGSGNNKANALFGYHTTGLLHYAVYVRCRPLAELFLQPPWYENIITYYIITHHSITSSPLLYIMAQTTVPFH